MGGGDFKGCCCAEDEGMVVGAVVAGRIVEADGVGVFSHSVEDDLFGRMAKGDGIVVHVAHLSHDKACQL